MEDEASRLLTAVFGLLCGRDADHLWAPAGVALPVCQRCTGLYLGSLVALALHLWARPQITGRFLWVHGGFLMLMVPFGFHWVPQNDLIRSGTGLFFAAGVVAFLRLVLPEGGSFPGGRPGKEPTTGDGLDKVRVPGGRKRSWCYYGALVATWAGLLVTGRWGAEWTSWALSWACGLGLLGLAGLVIAAGWALLARGWATVQGGNARGGST